MVRFTAGKRNGNWYYDQALTKIEKGELIERVRKQISLSSVNNSPYGFVDKRLLELLQEKISEDNYKASLGAKNRRAEMSFKGAIRRKEWKPTDAEIKEAERQIKEVKAKWTNPDGSRKKGYHCAPNGQESRLTEKQWLAVRTPFFKKWFGDWESLAEKDALLALNVINLERIDLSQFAIDEKRPVDARGVVAYLKEKYKDDVKDGVLAFEENPLGAPVEVGRYATSGFAGKNAGNAEAFLSLLNIKDILKDSVVINSETNWKNRSYDSAILANKVKIGNEEYISTVVVEQIPQANNKYKNRGYVVDAISLTRLNEGTVLQFNARVGDKAPFDTDNTVLMRNVLQNIWNVNKKDVSQVVDENGEPLVVYHGTPHYGFTVFDYSKMHERDRGSFGDGFYFTPSKSYAATRSTRSGCPEIAREMGVDINNPNAVHAQLPRLNTRTVG